MVLIVLFSYNRAIQLDYLIKSIFEKFKSPDFRIAIIFHTSGNHKLGYIKIKNKYAGYSNVVFLERKPHLFGLKSYLSSINNIPDIKRFLKYSRLFNKNSDNFKGMLETLLKTTECEYVMFNTDDGFFFDEIRIPNEILNLIKSKPFETSYRLYVGDNLDGFPDYIQKNDTDYYEWDYYKNSKITHWTYPFAVDGTVYFTKSILDIIKKVLYHNPITLEGYGVEFVIKRKVLKNGTGPITSNLVCTKLNRVSTSTLNPTINISPDFLNSKYLEGFELALELPVKITNANIVPNKVFLVKGNERLLIYAMDEKGEKVQNALGVEGAKEEME